MKQAIAYRLAEGTIPTFVSDGGYYSNNDLLVGISVDGLPLPEYVTVFNTKEELTTYLNTFANKWQPNPAYPDMPVLTVESAVDQIWAKLN
jgi:hypothetical protein